MRMRGRRLGRTGGGMGVRMGALRGVAVCGGDRDRSAWCCGGGSEASKNKCRRLIDFFSLSLQLLNRQFVSTTRFTSTFRTMMPAYLHVFSADAHIFPFFLLARLQSSFGSSGRGRGRGHILRLFSPWGLHTRRPRYVLSSHHSEHKIKKWQLE